MKRILFIPVLLASALFTQVKAQDSPVFPKGEIGKNTANYTGTIWLNELNEPYKNFNFSIAAATYAPASKLDWHIHPGGQILLITEGTGYYQEKGKPAQTVQKGDVIKSLPGVEHWHAAAPKSTFAYVAVSPARKGKTKWLQRVSEEEYRGITPMKWML
ncbi:cupin domain-containing protein [Pontibacter sp. CAU 1760]